MFELTVSKHDLLTALLTVAGAVDKKQSRAILGNILINIASKQLTLIATDLEIEITAWANIDSVTQAGAITVPAKKMVDIIRSLEDDSNPIISCDDTTVLIKVGRSKFKLATLPAIDYPNCTDEKNDIEFSIAKNSLIYLLQSTQFAMSQQDVRVFLNGMLLELNAAGLTAVATDGHRMAICKVECCQISDHHRFLVPRKAIQEILRLLNTISDESVLFSAGKNHIKISTSQFTFLTRLIEARFPAYTKAIPRNQDKQIVIDRDILKRALSRIVILANEKSRAVILHMEENQLTLIANNQEQEEAVEIVEAKTSGEELKIGINASYLLDALNCLDPGEVSLSMSNKESSILVESLKDEQYQYIIMPMKL